MEYYTIGSEILLVPDTSKEGCILVPDTSKEGCISVKENSNRYNVSFSKYLKLILYVLGNTVLL